MKKFIIAINGKGGVGKDTVCDMVGKHWPTVNVSSITPIKDIARANGWNGEKDPKSRKFLADLKRIFTEYNDLPTIYLIDEIHKFVRSDNQVFFAHIREGKEIDKFVRAAEIAGGDAVIKTLLVRNHSFSGTYGNSSDDDVENYQYDWIYENINPLAEMEKDVVAHFEKFFTAERQ